MRADTAAQQRVGEKVRLAAALVVAIVLVTAGGVPAPEPGASCSCCESGKCLLAAAGCDHGHAETSAAMTACCVSAPETPRTGAGAGSSGLDSAILLRVATLAGPSPQARPWQLRSPLPASPARGPEPPPPRPS